MAEGLLLSDYLKLATAFAENPTEENEEVLSDWLSEVQIKDYLPIKEKVLALMEILIRVDQEYDMATAAVQIEINKVVNGLIKYCPNITNDLQILDDTMGVYDAIQLYGLGKAIKAICNDDYKILCKMVDDAINIGNVKRFADTAALLNNTEYDKWVNTMRQLKEELTPEIIEGLIALGNLSDSDFSEFSRQLAKDMVKDADTEFVAQEIREQKLTEEEQPN